MAFLGGTFDATQIQPNQPFEVLPAGDYKCIITESEMADTKTGGQMLKLTLQVIEGEHTNRMLFDRLNLVNNNPKAVEIAQRTLSSICHAVGKYQVSDSSELHNLPLIASVKIRPASADGQYGPQNDIKGYKPATAQPAQQAPAQPAQQAAPAQQAPQAPAQQAAPAGTPPWMAGKAA
jgi:hypothetical protein